MPIGFIEKKKISVFYQFKKIIIKKETSNSRFQNCHISSVY
jgi:hypothetical protein